MFGTQGSLLDLAESEAFTSLARLERTDLAQGAWVDHRPGWLQGSQALFERLVKQVPWHAERRQMYDREVSVPRLTKFYGTGETLPDPLLDTARELLSEHYLPELGEPLTSAGLCLYRDHRDSVAWHGDTIGRGATHDTIVAILSVGEARILALRPRGGGPTTHRFSLGHGDLVVMGGSCQRTWEHAIPKQGAAAGPRISIQFRPAGVR